MAQFKESIGFSATAVFLTLGIATPSIAETRSYGRMVCHIIEKSSEIGYQEYTIERPVRDNGFVYYYSFTKYLPHFYLRFSGMAGAGAEFLYIGIEDTRTSGQAFTRVVNYGKITFFTKTETVTAECETKPDLP